MTISTTAGSSSTTTFYDYMQTAEDEIAERHDREKKAVEQDSRKLISLSEVVWSKVQPVPARRDEVDLMANANQKLLRLSKQKARSLRIHKVSNRSRV
jgi:hypothetical protein